MHRKSKRETKNHSRDGKPSDENTEASNPERIRRFRKYRISCGTGRRRKMLNKDKYAKEIIEIACNGEHCRR